MIYALEQGKTEQKIIADCIRARRPFPKAIANAPELLLGLEFTYGAYFELCSCRAFGWGMGPIPWTAIMDYARAHELDADDTHDFVYLVKELDKAHLEWISEKQAKESAAKK